MELITKFFHKISTINGKDPFLFSAKLVKTQKHQILNKLVRKNSAFKKDVSNL